MPWLKLNQYFQREKVLFIGQKMIDNSSLCQRLNADDDPVEQEAALREFIETAMPELRGIVIVGCQYSFELRGIKVLASHPTFPLVAEGDELPLEAVATKTWRDRDQLL